MREREKTREQEKEREDIFLTLAMFVIMSFGLNRYAVLGRSSRLWSSVVLDQASPFVIFHA